MDDDIETLTLLNIRIGEEETKGGHESRRWLEDLIAPKLAFRRADQKTYINRDEFLSAVGPSAGRDTEVRSVTVLGKRAIVECVVKMKSPDSENVYSNLRLFVREDSGWKILGWANEPV